MGKIGYTFEMMRSSWEILKKDKELLVFPLLSAICCLLVLASFAVPMFMTDSWQPPERATATPQQQVAYYGVLFFFYFVTYFIIIFFNSAIVACAIFRMRGGDPNLQTGISAAMSRLPQIFAWALVSATVGVILRIIEDKSKRVGQIVAGVLGMAWTVLTFLVVPILVVERKGPFQAIGQSTVLLKKTWGQQLIGNFSFGLIFFGLSIIGIVPIAISFFVPTLALKVVLIAAGVLYLIALSLVQSTLQTIFQAALYLYAKDGVAPAGFSSDDLHSAMGQR